MEQPPYSRFFSKEILIEETKHSIDLLMFNTIHWKLQNRIPQVVPGAP